MQAKPNEAREWLFAHVEFSGDECLTWPFCRDPYYGRGRIGALDGGNTNHWAHRIMCELAHGPAPSKRHQAAHTCGKGHEGCVNPKHLAWKTNSENQRDRRKHGTHRGATGNRTKLTTEQISEIRRWKGKMPQLALARLLGVKRGCIEYWQRDDHEPAPPRRDSNAA